MEYLQILLTSIVCFLGIAYDVSAWRFNAHWFTQLMLNVSAGTMVVFSVLCIWIYL